MKKVALSALVIGLMAGNQQAFAGPDMVRSSGLGAVVGAVAGAAVNHDARGKGALIGGVLGGLGGAAYSHFTQDVETGVKSAVGRDLAAHGITVEQIGENGVNITIPDRVAFEPGSSTLTPLSYRILDEIGRTLAKHPDTLVTVTATNPADAAQYVDLARERAQVTASQLAARGISPQRLTAAIESPTVSMQWRGEDLLNQPLQQRYAAGMPRDAHSTATTSRSSQRYEHQQRNQHGSYQPHRPVPGYGVPGRVDKVERVGLGGLMKGVVGAITQGPEAGLRAGVAEVLRGGTSAATQEARSEINEEISDIRYDR